MVNGDKHQPSPRPEPLEPTAAFEAIQHILVLPGSVTFTDHCLVRGRQRGFDTFDLYHALETGTVSRHVDWDAMRREWVYRVSGHDLDGDPLTVKVVIDRPNHRLRVVTAHD
jgi:hypothetical protein